MNMKKLVMVGVASLFAGVFAIDGVEIKDVKARQRYPWNGLVDVRFMVEGSAEGEKLATLIATDCVGGTNVPLATLIRDGQSVENGKVAVTNGANALIWNAAADLPDGFRSDSMKIAANVQVAPRAQGAPRYLVINLTDNPSAATYPVAYLDAEPPGGFNTDEYKSRFLVLKRIDAGNFRMQGKGDVMLTKPFYIGLFAITKAQYEFVMNGDSSFFEGRCNPVVGVSYNTIRGAAQGANWPASNAVDADSFLGKLRARTGIEFDLPTEAQWEYACRAGSSSPYSYGGRADGDYMWYVENSESKAQKVGLKAPNPWGLYDMHGNVWEWCLDWEGSLTYGSDPVGASSGSTRV